MHMPGTAQRKFIQHCHAASATPILRLLGTLRVGQRTMRVCARASWRLVPLETISKLVAKITVVRKDDIALRVTPILTFPHQGGRDF